MGTIAQIFESGKQSANNGLFKNLVMLARVDGFVDESEKQLLNRIANRLSLTAEQVAEIIANPNDYPMIPPTTKEERFDRFVQFIEMICIDNVIAPEEEQLANKYGIALGFNGAQIEEIEGAIITQVKNGKSRDEIVTDLM